VILIKKRFLLPVTYFPINLVYPFTLRVTGIINENGQHIKYKARLVARGFIQEYLLDYDETFASFSRISSFRFILSIANQFNLKVHHMDVKTAFLNGILKREI